MAAWRLSEGPIRTDFLTPHLQEAINRASSNSVDVGGTFLIWEEGSRGLVLHAAEVVVRDADNNLIASLPEVAFELSASAVLRGTLAPHQIEIIAPRIRLVRGKDGRIGFGDELEVETTAPADAARGESLVLGSMIEELLAERNGGSPLSFLDEVRIRDGQLFVRDEMFGISWAAPSAEISLRRDIAGLAGDISLSFAGHRDPATFDAAFLFDKSAQVVDLAAGFSDISLAALAEAIPELAPVGGLTSRISGSISTSVTLDGKLGHTGFDIQGFAGTLKIPGIEMAAFPVRDLNMRGRYDSDERRFDLEEARIALGDGEAPGPVFGLAGALDYDPLSGDWRIDTDATLEGMRLAELATYWPESIASDARPWVLENVTDGVVDKATAALAAEVPQGDFSVTQVTGMTGTLQYRDLEVHYLRPLPSIRKIGGTAKFDLDSLRFAVETGRLEGLALGDSQVQITGFSAADPKRGLYEKLTIDTTAVGPVHDVLALLEHPRLDLLSRLGFSSTGSGGAVSARLAFQFPLAKSLSFDDVTLQTEASVYNGELKGVFLGQDMTDAQLSIVLDQSGMQLSGPLNLGGVPLSASWKESFAASAKVRSVLEAEIPRSSDEERARFGLDIGEAVRGPLAAKVSMISRDDGLSTLQISADLKEASISLPEIHWRKEPGIDGSLGLTVEMDSGGPLAYRDIVLQAGDLTARGKASPGRDRQGLGSIDLERVTFGRSNLQDVALLLDEDGIDVAIGRGILDAEPFLSDDAEKTGQEEPPAPPETGPARTPRSYQPLSIRAPDLEVLYFAGERRLERVNLELRRRTTGWETIRLSGSIPEQYWSPSRPEPSEAAPPEPELPEKEVLETQAGDSVVVEEVKPDVTAELTRRYLQFSFAPDAAGSGQRLLAQSDDLGALLRATNIADTVVGGRIQITGQSAGPSPTHPIEAKVQARDFVMVNAPAMAKLLTVASFTGVLDLLRGEGIPFQGMDGDFVLDDGVATTELMRIYGASLGLTAKGEIDFDNDAIDLTGVVVPAYSINNFLSKIPLLGTLLTGGEGEGLFAVVYKVKGEVDDPEVSVNPLSALTPGFLRNIFTAEPGSAEGQAIPEKRERIDK
ncbi:AsmA-like C-terminal domain-containing protein [Pelagibius sp. CAU 1746]|uniref:YhdP family protein n=1 Tax=Pelagibius sp. CAU 1746 TaxID=3140370 RepID=UPI00325BFE5E